MGEEMKMKLIMVEGVGIDEINIRSRTKYQELIPVVGAMTSPIGIRY